MKKVTLNDKIRAYCAQQLDKTQDSHLAMKVVVMAPLALLANETALAQ